MNEPRGLQGNLQITGDDTNVTYQWQEDGVDITGETTNSITLGETIVGKTFTYIATYQAYGQTFELSADFHYQQVIYVDQTNGADANPGTVESPVQTLKQAYALLINTDIAESNVIVIIGDYTTSGVVEYSGRYSLVFPEITLQDNDSILWQPGKAATITSKYDGVSYDGKIVLNYNVNSNSSDYHGLLMANTVFENIDFGKTGRSGGCNFFIYANGFDITIGENVSFDALENASPSANNGIPDGAIGYNNVHIVGGGENGCAILGGIENTITVSSGNIARIIGGSRNGNTFSNGVSVNGYTYNYDKTPPAENLYQSHIIVNGDASVAIVVGGQPDGIYHGSSDIVVDGNANIVQITGGNQGQSRLVDAKTNGQKNYDGDVYNEAEAKANSPYFNDFKGSISITIRGGTVGTIYAGNTVRSLNQSRVLGNIQLTMLGGNVGTIYGAGASSDVGTASSESSITMNLQGGTITGDVYGGAAYDSPYNVANAPGTLKGTVYGDITITLGENLSVDGSVYGGGDSRDVTGNTQITINGAQVEGSIIAGGNAIDASANVGGNATIIMNSGSVNDIFSHGVGTETHNVAGTKSIIIMGGDIPGTVVVDENNPLSLPTNGQEIVLSREIIFTDDNGDIIADTDANTLPRDKYEPQLPSYYSLKNTYTDENGKIVIYAPVVTNPNDPSITPENPTVDPEDPSEPTITPDPSEPTVTPDPGEPTVTPDPEEPSEPTPTPVTPQITPGITPSPASDILGAAREPEAVIGQTLAAQSSNSSLIKTGDACKAITWIGALMVVAAAIIGTREAKLFVKTKKSENE